MPGPARPVAPAGPSGIAERLLTWHDPTARRLAWRSTTDPWLVLVSEVMAQQTQAERAAVAWRAFADRWPTPAALAAATTADVVEAWAGLGYNRRAVNLHRCAQAVVADHGGRLPDDLDALLALPGVGPYTARAVLAFAFGRDVLPVDTNVARVLARTAGEVLTTRAARDRADELVAAHPGRGPALAAALMDLGATTCTARRPRCDRCPLAGAPAGCAWRGGAAVPVDGPADDPAAAGAHRPTAQGRWAGSARQARGRLVAALRERDLAMAEATALAGDHGPALLDRLVADGLAERTPGGLALPGRGKVSDGRATG